MMGASTDCDMDTMRLNDIGTGLLPPHLQKQDYAPPPPAMPTAMAQMNPLSAPAPQGGTLSPVQMQQMHSDGGHSSGAGPSVEIVHNTAQVLPKAM